MVKLARCFDLRRPKAETKIARKENVDNKLTIMASTAHLIKVDDVLLQDYKELWGRHDM